MIPTDLFIVTFSRDFPYLRYCLKSIAKFAKHFNFLRVLVPDAEVTQADQLISEANILFPARAFGYEEKTGKGMLWHMRQIMHADTHTDGEHIVHFDADCIFIKPVTPESFLQDGKIILRYEPFVTIVKRHPPILRWQTCTQACLPFPVRNETMRAHPGVFHRSTYELARKCMVQATGKPVDDYIYSCENAFPQTFCEFNTLGNVAMEKQAHLYMPIKQLSDAPLPPAPIQQFWSHGPIDKPQEVWTAGKPNTIVPIQFINHVLAE